MGLTAREGAVQGPTEPPRALLAPAVSVNQVLTRQCRSPNVSLGYSQISPRPLQSTWSCSKNSEM